MKRASIVWLLFAVTVWTVSPAAAQDDAALFDPVATLKSLEQVDAYPLYTMTYYGGYEDVDLEQAIQDLLAGESSQAEPEAQPAWGCSLFAAYADAESALYGRNFDWEFSPAVLLFTNPPDGYASVSMVDIGYFNFSLSEAESLTDLPVEERGALLYAPYMPFDGMNEHGLVVGMAAVPASQLPLDLDKTTINSIRIIREMLDHAQSVDEAVDLIGSYNITMEGGPPLHYLIADLSGQSALVEFYEGEMHVIPNETNWQVATNFLRVAAGDSAEGQCWRYDAISSQLTESDGRASVADAVDILSAVSQDSTQWSVVYDMSALEIHVAMGRQYDNVHTFALLPAGE